MIISVIGGSSAKPEHVDLAEEVGRLLARRNVMVACGGKTGVMGSRLPGGQVRRRDNYRHSPRSHFPRGQQLR